MERNLRLLTVAAAVRTFGASLYSPFLALYLTNVLRLPYVAAGAILAGIGLASLPFSFVGGLLADRVGRRRLILLGLVGEGLATAGLSFAFAVRSVDLAIAAGLAAALVTTTAGPAVGAYIADLATGPERTRGYTYYRIGFNVGFAAGPALGGVLISLVGFAGSVAVATGVVATGAAIVAAGLEPSPRDRELQATSQRREGRSPSTLPGRPGRSIGASLRRLAHDRTTLELLLAVSFAALALGQWGVTFPLYIHNVLKVDYALLGIGIALNGLVVVFGQAFTTERVLGQRLTTIAILGVGCYVAAFLAVGAAAFWAAASVVVFFVAVVILTLGENLVTIPQSTLPPNLAPREEIGLYNGAFGTVAGLGGVLAVLLGGYVLGAVANPLLVWSLLVLPAVPSVLLFRHAGRRLPDKVDRA